MKCIFSNEKDVVTVMGGWKTYKDRCFLSNDTLIVCNGEKDKENCPFWNNQPNPNNN